MNTDIGMAENRAIALNYIRGLANRSVDKKAFNEEIEKYNLSSKQIQDLLEDYNITLLELSERGQETEALFKNTLNKPYIKDIIGAFDSYWAAKGRLDQEIEKIEKYMHNLIDKSAEMEKIKELRAKIDDAKLKAENSISETSIRFRTDLIRYYTPRPTDAEIFDVLKFEPGEDELLVLLDEYRKNPVATDKIVQYGIKKGYIEETTFPYYTKEDKLEAFKDICRNYKAALTGGYGLEVVKHSKWIDKMIHYGNVLGDCKYIR